MLKDIDAAAVVNRGYAFSARNCNNTPVPIYIESLDISPDPLVMVGDTFIVSFSGNVTVTEMVALNNTEVIFHLKSYAYMSLNFKLL